MNAEIWFGFVLGMCTVMLLMVVVITIIYFINYFKKQNKIMQEIETTYQELIKTEKELLRRNK